MAAKDFIIVIGRQFGSGGRILGKALASRLGIPYYDHNLLSETAGSMGLAPGIFDSADERRPSIFRSFLGSTYGNANDFGQWGTLGREQLYSTQSRVIRRICESGPCVVVGRTADYICRDLPNMASIFVHAPLEHRAARIVKRKDAVSLEEASRLAQKRDRDRENYYNYFTGRNWGKASNYDLCIDASKISVEQAVDLITSWLDMRAAN